MIGVTCSWLFLFNVSIVYIQNFWPATFIMPFISWLRPFVLYIYILPKRITLKLMFVIHKCMKSQFFYRGFETFHAFANMTCKLQRTQGVSLSTPVLHRTTRHKCKLFWNKALHHSNIVMYFVLQEIKSYLLLYIYIYILQYFVNVEISE